MRSTLVAAGFAATVAAAAPARAEVRVDPVRITVYADADRDGQRGPGEAGVAGAVVVFGIAQFAVTDARGEATLDLPAGTRGAVWVRVPEGFEPRPAWAAWPAATSAIAIGLQPLAQPLARPLRFVVASDAHISAVQPFSHDLAAIARDAVALDPPPALLALLGDTTQGGRDEQFELVDAQLAGLGVPVVRVAGNHDWYDAGAAWTPRYGPDNFSFDAGGTHFVVWNMALSDAEVRAFVAADLARVDRTALTIVALTHAPPSPAVAAALRDLGVAAVLTGHLHGNRAVDHDGMRELSTEPLLMGGIDGTPAGYRIVTVDHGRVTAEDRTLYDAPGAAPASPAAGPCAMAGVPRVARWAAGVGGHVITAAPAIAAGMVYVVVTDLAEGDAGGVVALELATGAERWHVTTALPVRGAAAVVGDTVVIAQIDGAVLGLDAATGALRWRTDVSDGISPPAGAVFAGPTADDGDVLVGGQRRFAAIDARTGRERWAVDPIPDAPPWVDFAVLAPVAVARGLAIGTFAREQSGVAAFDRATGALAWRVDEHSVQPASPAIAVDTLAIGIAAAPVVAGDSVYLATSADEVAALDVDTGAVRWRTQLDPRGFDWGAAILGTPAYARGILVVPTLYDDAVAVDAASGAVLWRHAAGRPSPLRVTHYRGAGEAGFASSPVIADDVVWLASTDGTLVALALDTGDELWRAPLGAPVIAGLAIAGEVLVVASYDGTVRALAPGMPPGATTCREPPAPAPMITRGGSCVRVGVGVGVAVAVAALAYALTVRRRSARSRSARRARRPT